MTSYNFQKIDHIKISRCAGRKEFGGIQPVGPIGIKANQQWETGYACPTHNLDNYARTWFRIGHQGGRYLHTGEVTAGCATVDAVESWDEICKVLLRSRLDSQTVGTLEVLP